MESRVRSVGERAKVFGEFRGDRRKNRVPSAHEIPDYNRYTVRYVVLLCPHFREGVRHMDWPLKIAVAAVAVLLPTTIAAVIPADGAREHWRHARNDMGEQGGRSTRASS